MPLENRREVFIVAALISLHLALCLHTASVKTITHDEIWHLPIGLAIFQEGDFSVENLNPPLTRMWAAIPLYLAGLKVEEVGDMQAMTSQFLETNDWEQWYFIGRIFNIFWSVLTAIIVYVWSREFFGRWGASLSLLLYATSPNVIAHASLVTPDAGLMCGFVATLYFAHRCGQSPSWLRTFVLGVVLGLTLGVKYTAVLLLPLTLIPILLSKARTRSWFGVTAHYVAACVVALSVLNSTMLFHGSMKWFSDYQFQSDSLQSLQTSPILGSLPVPFPEDYVLGVDTQRHIMSLPHPSFLDGEWSFDGFRNYFYKAILYKTQLITLLAGLIAIPLCFFKVGTGRSIRAMLMFCLPSLALIHIANQTGVQLGIRYVLPVLALLMILAGRTGSLLEKLPAKMRWGVVVFAGVSCHSAMLNHPHHLAYFNEYAGGSEAGPQHLLDSNIDWGQDLYLVKSFIEKRSLENVHLAYFGTFLPDLMDIHYQLPRSFEPSPGWHFVSVNYVYGRPHTLVREDRSRHSTMYGEYSYFQFFEPEVRLGNSIYGYDFKDEDLQRWKRNFPSSK